MSKGEHKLLAYTALLLLSLTTLYVNFQVVYKSPANNYGNFVISHSYTIINVSDYQGSTDSERIQNALNDVPPEGAIVFIPSGVWEANNLTAKSNTIILGTNGTILKRPQNTTSPFITFINQTNFAVINITFDGLNIPKARGLLIINCTNFQVINNVFLNIERYAVSIYGKSHNFEIKNNIFINSNMAPILLFGSPGLRLISNFRIINNTVIDAANNGKIAVAFASNGEIINNYVRNCEYGIGTRNISNVTISSNVIENCSSYGIYLGTQPGDPGTWNIVLINNFITNSKIGIARYYGSYPVTNITLINNTVTDNQELDVYADFPAAFINNTFTSKRKLKFLVSPTQFSGNTNLNGDLIMLGDINNDGKVDMKDVGIIARLYGSTETSDNWIQDADIIQDGIIDMRDVAIAAREFGLPN